jgi:hypothetical protein
MLAQYPADVWQNIQFSGTAAAAAAVIPFRSRGYAITGIIPKASLNSTVVHFTTLAEAHTFLEIE